MKKIGLIVLILVLLTTSVCFAEKCRLKKKQWSPFQIRTEKGIEVTDYYNRFGIYKYEKDKQIGLYIATFVPEQKEPDYSYFHEAVVFDYGAGKYAVIKTYQANRKNKIDKETEKTFLPENWQDISGSKYEKLYSMIRPPIW